MFSQILDANKSPTEKHKMNEQLQIYVYSKKFSKFQIKWIVFVVFIIAKPYKTIIAIETIQVGHFCVIQMKIKNIDISTKSLLIC